MAVRYFRRYRMEIATAGAAVPALPVPALPAGCRWTGWDPRLAAVHALVKAQCFAGSLDAQLFPCLSNYAGCHRLMRNLADRSGFCPAATWLIDARDGPVAAVQGVLLTRTLGMIHNIGVVPGCRDRGLGSLLLRRCLAGFAEAGAERVRLEVTAENQGAVRLYVRLGFVHQRTLYRGVGRRR